MLYLNVAFSIILFCISVILAYISINILNDIIPIPVKKKKGRRGCFISILTPLLIRKYVTVYHINIGKVL